MLCVETVTGIRSADQLEYLPTHEIVYMFLEKGEASYCGGVPN